MTVYESELIHHGIKGMKWGVRRYQDYGEGGYNPKQRRKAAKRVFRNLQKGNRGFLVDTKRKKSLEDTAKEVDTDSLKAALSPESKEMLKKAHSSLSQSTRACEQAKKAFVKKFGSEDEPDYNKRMAQYNSKEYKRWEKAAYKMFDDRRHYNNVVKSVVDKDLMIYKSLKYTVVSRDKNNRNDAVCYEHVVQKAIDNLNGQYDLEPNKKKG